MVGKYYNSRISPKIFPSANYKSSDRTTDFYSSSCYGNICPWKIFRNLQKSKSEHCTFILLTQKKIRFLFLNFGRKYLKDDFFFKLQNQRKQFDNFLIQHGLKMDCSQVSSDNSVKCHLKDSSANITFILIEHYKYLSRNY